MCGQSPGRGDGDRNHIVDKPYRPDETLHQSSRMPRRSGDRHEPRRCTYCTGAGMLACHGVVCNGTTVRATEVTQMKFKLLPAAIFMAAGWGAAPPQAAGR